MNNGKLQSLDFEIQFESEELILNKSEAEGYSQAPQQSPGDATARISKAVWPAAMN